MFCNTCRNVAFVCRTRLSTSIQQGCFIHYQFRNRSGKVSPWTMITGFPKVQGRDCLYVMVDWLTKFAHFFAISFDYFAAQVAELFFREVFRLHKLPKTIVSDRDSRFTGAFWKELFKLLGTELATNTSYHPQSDGKTEIVNTRIEGYLRNYVTG